MRRKSPFIVEVREIPDDGLKLDFDLSGDFAAAALEGTESDPETARVASSLELTKANENVFVRGSLKGSVTIPCSRCAADAPFAVDVPVHMTYQPQVADEDDSDEAEELDVSAEDVDYATYADDQIDLGELLREQLLLALPMTHLCREACKGLCPTCGTDRNLGACECPPEPKDDRFGALRNVKL